MAVISPTCMFSVSAKLSIRADNGTYFGSFFHYPAYHLVAYGQGRPQKAYDTAFYPVWVLCQEKVQIKCNQFSLF